jgi:uncharacterized membrane protein YeaQ/YmgE (transglycosylase-associated protein family)
MRAASHVAREHGLNFHEPVVLHEGSNLLLHLEREAERIIERFAANGTLSEDDAALLRRAAADANERMDAAASRAPSGPRSSPAITPRSGPTPTSALRGTAHTYRSRAPDSGYTESMIGFLVFGLVVGLLARLILPGRQNIGLLWTLALGVIGSVIGGTIANAIGSGDILELNFIGAVAAIASSVVLLAVAERSGLGKGDDHRQVPGRV